MQKISEVYSKAVGGTWLDAHSDFVGPIYQVL